MNTQNKKLLKSLNFALPVGLKSKITFFFHTTFTQNVKVLMFSLFKKLPESFDYMEGKNIFSSCVSLDEEYFKYFLKMLIKEGFVKKGKNIFTKSYEKSGFVCRTFQKSYKSN